MWEFWSERKAAVEITYVAAYHFSVDLTVDISCPHYDLLVKYCNCFSLGYRVLKSGVIVTRQGKSGNVERVVEIRCTQDEAKLLLDLAKSVCPEAVPEIEKSISTLREL